MEAVLRQAFEQMPLTQVQVEHLIINIVTKRVTINTRAVRLTSKQYKLLERLAMGRGRIVTDGELLEHMVGPGTVRSGSYVKVFLHQVKAKLAEASGGKNYIERARKAGYTLRPPPLLGP